MVTATFQGDTPCSSSAKGMVTGGQPEEVVRLRVSLGGKFVMVSGRPGLPAGAACPARPLRLAAARAGPRPDPRPPRLQTEKAVWKYVGGDTFMHTVPVAWKYAELMFSLAEKVDGAVSVKYQLPGEELDPDSLISVSDDSDLQVRAGRGRLDFKRVVRSRRRPGGCAAGAPAGPASWPLAAAGGGRTAGAAGSGTRRGRRKKRGEI